MAKFFVELGFKKPLPAFAVESVEAKTSAEAVVIAKGMASSSGWNAPAKKVTVRVLSNKE